MAFGLGEEVISAIYLAKEDQERDSFTWWGWLDIYFQSFPEEKQRKNVFDLGEGGWLYFIFPSRMEENFFLSPPQAIPHSLRRRVESQTTKSHRSLVDDT